MHFRRPLAAFVLTLVCAVFAALPLRAADSAALEKRFVEANEKLNAKDYAAALEIYNEILEAQPSAGNVWINRAVAKWNLKDKSGARADLAQAINLHPDNVDAYRVRASLRYDAGDHQASLADLNKAIELTQDDAEIYGMRGEVQKQLGYSTAAIQDLSRAIELAPKYTAALYTRAQLYEQQGESANAIADYTRAIELDPKHADALNNRAWLRFHALDWDAAIADARKALEIVPDAAVALRVTGYAQFAKGDYAGAAETLARAADADAATDASTSAYALFIRHHALLRNGGADKRLAASLGDWKSDVWVQAIAKFIVGQISEDELETAAKDTPDDGELMGRACEMHFYIGLARKQAGDKSTARLRFQSAIGTGQKTYIEHALASAELKRL